MLVWDGCAALSFSTFVAWADVQRPLGPLVFAYFLIIVFLVISSAGILPADYILCVPDVPYSASKPCRAMAVATFRTLSLSLSTMITTTRVHRAGFSIMGITLAVMLSVWINDSLRICLDLNLASINWHQEFLQIRAGGEELLR